MLSQIILSPGLLSHNLITGNGKVITIYDFQNSIITTKKIKVPGGYQAMSILTNGNIIVSKAKRQEIVIINPATGKNIKDIPNLMETSTLTGLQDGNILSTGLCDGHTIRVLNLSTFEAENSLQHGSAAAAALLPNGSVVYGGGAKNELHIYDPEYYANTKYFSDLEYNINAIAALPNGHIVIAGASASDQICILDPKLDSQYLIKTIQQYGDGVIAMAALPNGHIIVAGKSKIRIINLDTNELEYTSEYKDDELSAELVNKIRDSDPNRQIEIQRTDMIAGISQEALQQLRIDKDSNKYFCPIFHEPIVNPVVINQANTDISFWFEEKTLKDWFESSGKRSNPLTNEDITEELFVNKMVQKEIKDFFTNEKAKFNESKKPRKRHRMS